MGIMPDHQHGLMTSLCYKHSEIFKIVSSNSLAGHMDTGRKTASSIMNLSVQLAGWQRKP